MALDSVILSYPNLAAYYKCDEVSGATLADSSGNNLPLTLTVNGGGYTLGMAGPKGAAVALTGGTYASRTSCVLGATLPSAWTIFSLVRGAASDNNAAIALSNISSDLPFVQTGTGATASSPAQSTSSLRFGTRNDAASPSFDYDKGGGVAFDNKWHSILIQYDNGLYRQFVDGVLVNSGSATQGTTTLNRTALGAVVRGGGNVNAWAGSIQHVAFYTTALNDYQIEALHRESDQKQIYFMDAGGDSTQNLLTWNYSQGTISYDSTQKITGTGSIKCTSDSGTAQVGRTGVLADNGRRISFWLRSALNSPSSVQAQSALFARIKDTAQNTIFGIGIDNNSKFTITGATDLLRVTSAASYSLAATTWIRVCICYTLDSSSTNRIVVYADGNKVLDASNVASLGGTTPGQGSTLFSHGPSAAWGTPESMWFDNLYIDNDITGYEDTGNVYVTAKLPTTTVSNQWTTVGTGAVNERPSLTTNGKSAANNSGFAQTYLIQDAATGDVNISGMRMLGYMGWVLASQGTVNGTPVLYANNQKTNLTLTTASLLYTAAQASSTFPTSSPAIGLSVSGGTTALTTMSECGMLVAYTDKSIIPQATKLYSSRRR